MRLPALLVLPALPAVVGCAGNVASGDTLDADARTTTSAVLTVERSAGAAQGSRAEASARFLRVTGSSTSDDALRAIGAGLDLPAAGTCASISSLSGALAGPAPVIELVDVGPVSLEAAGVETRLAPRQLPDVTDLVSGVVYARATDPALLPAATEYTVHLGGPGVMGSIDVPAAAPGDPADVRITGEDDTGTVVAGGASIDLSWSSAHQADLLYVDVQPSGVRCVFDDGAERASVSTMYLDEAGSLSVHRLRRTPIDVPGVDSGEIRFDFARSVTYVRR